MTTPPTPPPPPGSGVPAAAPGQAEPSAVEPKRSRKWPRRLGIGAAGLLGLIVVSSALGGGGDDPDEPSDDDTEVAGVASQADDDAAPGDVADPVSSEESAAADAAIVVDEVGADGVPANPGALYPERLGIEDNDHEAALGEALGYAGWNTTVSGASQSISDDALNGGARLLTVDVRLFNRQEESASFSSGDFSLQVEGGALLDIDIWTDGQIDSFGEMASGGVVEGTVVFDLGDATGRAYVIHEPGLFDDARGIWAVDLT